MTLQDAMMEWSINTNYKYFSVQSIMQNNSQQLVVLNRESVQFLDLTNGNLTSHKHLSGTVFTALSWSSHHPNSLILAAQNKIFIKSIDGWKIEHEIDCGIEEAGEPLNITCSNDTDNSCL